MKVTIREKRISNNRLRLYLDYYPAIINPQTGKSSRRENLGLYCYDNVTYLKEEYQTTNGNRCVRYIPVEDNNGKLKKTKLTPSQLKHNKETRQQAEYIRSERQLQVQKRDYSFLLHDETADFLGLFEDKALKELEKGYTNVKAAYNIFNEYCNSSCPIAKLTPDFCKGFQNYLKKYIPKYETKKRLANSCQILYWGFFKTSVKEALNKKLLTEDPTIGIKAIKKINESQREYLTLGELKAAYNTPCDMEELKRACLFSAKTGLRHSDIIRLCWRHISKHGNDYIIRFNVQKTKEAEQLFITQDTYNLLGNKGAFNERIFPKIKRSPWQNELMRKWLIKAGITKHITFHCFRHTYATLQLTLGTDIFTISKLLGHKSVSTTQIYARLVDEKKKEAARKIVLF